MRRDHCVEFEPDMTGFFHQAKLIGLESLISIITGVTSNAYVASSPLSEGLTLTIT